MLAKMPVTKVCCIPLELTFILVSMLDIKFKFSTGKVELSNKRSKEVYPEINV